MSTPRSAAEAAMAGPEVAQARGRGIRRRRRGLLVGGSMAAVVAVVAALNLTPAPAGPPPQVSAALALVAQTEPQCTWPVSDDATDVQISPTRFG
jgi:hypothetical protein